MAKKKNKADAVNEPETEPKPKPEQTFIEGMEPVRLKDIDDAMDEYVAKRDLMQAAVRDFKENGKTPLELLMHAHMDKGDIQPNGKGEFVYRRHDNRVVKLIRTKETLKVTDAEDEDDVTLNEAPEDTSEGN